MRLGSSWSGKSNSIALTIFFEWIGNSQAVAAKHYLRVTECDFGRAIPKAAQNAAQQTTAEARGDEQAQPTAHEKSPVLPSFAAQCDFTQIGQAPPVGLECTSPVLLLHWHHMDDAPQVLSE